MDGSYVPTRRIVPPSGGIRRKVLHKLHSKAV